MTMSKCNVFNFKFWIIDSNLVGDEDEEWRFALVDALRLMVDVATLKMKMKHRELEDDEESLKMKKSLEKTPFGIESTLVVFNYNVQVFPLANVFDFS